jgi:hypothetical protein
MHKPQGLCIESISLSGGEAFGLCAVLIRYDRRRGGLFQANQKKQKIFISKYVTKLHAEMYS